MNSGFYAAVSAIALLSSGAVQAALNANIASITQGASSSESSATITQINSLTSSSAFIVQDADGSGNNRATATIIQGDGFRNQASNSAKIEQRSVTEGADITLTQAGDAGGTNFADVLQSSLAGGSAKIDQYTGASGTNTIGSQFSNVQSNQNSSVGFEQTGSGNTASINQRSSGATNIMIGVTQNGTGSSFTVNQGQTASSGGNNEIANVTVNGNLTVNQSSDAGINALRNFSGGGTNSTITQTASGGDNYIGGDTTAATMNVSIATVTITQTAYSGMNKIGQEASSVTGGDVTITQETSGATYLVNLNMTGGDLTIKQLSEIQGQGTVSIAAFSGGTGRIEQRAASNGGVNEIVVASYNDSSSSLAIFQNGSDNSINVNRNYDSSENNIDDDGLESFNNFDLFYSRLTVEQYGTDNKANLNQHTAKNVGRIFQQGSGNEATIDQLQLSSGTAYIVQLGSNGIATINQ